jgi:hypothetical protein
MPARKNSSEIRRGNFVVMSKVGRIKSLTICDITMCVKNITNSEPLVA